MKRDVGLFQKAVQLAQDNEGKIHKYDLNIAFSQDDDLLGSGYMMNVDNKRKQLTIIRHASESPEHELVKCITYLAHNCPKDSAADDETFRIEVEELLRVHHNLVRAHG